MPTAGRWKSARNWPRRTPPCQAYVKVHIKSHSALIRLLQKLGRLQEAAEASQTLQAYIEAIPTKTSADLYDLACVRARNAEWIGADKNELTDAEKRQREQLYASALQTLEEAVSQGYDNAEWATKDEDLTTLRDRPEFMALTARMEQIAQARKLAKDAKAAKTPAEKLKANEQAQAVLQNLVEQEPANLRHQVDLAYSLYSAGMAQRELREYAPAEQSLTRALALNEELVQQSPETVAYRRYVGSTSHRVGNRSVAHRPQPGSRTLVGQGNQALRGMHQGGT